jgi:FAD/FMN-containing dehydrogenase
MYGLACDNVESYELVTASGMIINVSENSFSDLYWALRGGGNNFGLVTECTLQRVSRRTSTNYANLQSTLRLSPEHPKCGAARAPISTTPTPVNN